MKLSFFQKIRSILFLVFVGFSTFIYSQSAPQITYKTGSLDFGTFYVTSSGTIELNPETNSRTESPGIFSLNSPLSFVEYELVANKNFIWVINATSTPVQLTGTGLNNNGNKLNFTLLFDKTTYQTTDNKIGIPVFMGGILSVDPFSIPGPYSGTISVTVTQFLQ